MPKQFRKAFCPNPAPRFDAEPLRKICEHIVYVCDTPIFDDLAGPENKHRFESRVEEAMNEFDPEKDLLVFFGDAIIFAMMIWYVSMELEADNVSIARFSVKSDEYVIRKLV